MRKIFFSLILCTAVFLSACTTQQNNPSPVPSPELSPTPEQSSQSINGSLTDLTKQGTKQCTYSYREGSMANIGTFYIHNGKMAGESTISEGDIVSTNKILLVDNIFYSWELNSKKGVKMDYLKMQEFAKSLPSTSPQAATNNTPDLSKKYDFDCQDWSVDESVFAVPKDVEFTDLMAQMEGLKNMQNKIPSNLPADACGACDNFSGTQKNECRKALNC